MNKRNFFNIVLSLTLVFYLSNCAFAIVDTSEDANKSAKKTVKAKKEKKNKNKENTQQIPYTNDIHSKFTLKDCVDIAVKYNPFIQASIFNEEVYKSEIGRIWANYFPVLSAGADFTRLRDKYSGTDYSLISGNSYHNLAYVPTISGQMMVFDFGKTKASADMAKRTYEASKAETSENINTIIYDIKYAYYNILFAQAQVKVYKDTVADYQLQLKQAEGFYKIGKKAKIDVVTAEYNLGKAQLNLVKAENVLQVALVNLSKIMGIPEYSNYELVDNLSLNVYDEPFEDVIQRAFKYRPELIKAEKSVEAYKMNLRAKKRNYTPDLGIFASYGNGIGSEYDVISTQFGVGLQYSSINLMRVQKEITQARAYYNKAKADYEDTKDSIYFSVKKNYMELETNKEAIIIAKLSLDQAKEQYRQVTGRYKAGVGDAIELKDGENTYLNARLDFYNAMLNYNVSAASLEHEIGVPIEFSDKLIIKPDKL